MSGLLDASIVVHYLLNEPPEMGHAAAQIVEHADGLILAPVALAEVAYVLTTVYQQPRAEVVDALHDLLQRENVSVLGIETPLVLQALAFCRPSNRVSFADALIWAEARQSGERVVYTFDRRFPRDGIELRTSPAAP